MLVYTAYLSAAAVAGSPAPKLGLLAGAHAGLLPVLAADKSEIFKKPTDGDLSEELACLALNVYFEARGEPDAGQLAVAHVVMNRVASKRYPDTVCGVVRQGGELRRYRCQFTWWCDGRSDTPRSLRDWKTSNEVALEVYWGHSKDPTHGAMWYHADYVDPNWRHTFEHSTTIGRHIFYRTPGEGPKLASRSLKTN